MSDDLSPLTHFAGTARLFPLPNLVLFPHVMQPLHVFEPRYRQMTADALTGDRLIGLVLLKPGWEADYEGKPAVPDVQKGDVLISVDSARATGGTMGQVWSSLEGNSAQVRTLVLERAGKQFEVKATVRHFLAAPQSDSSKPRK